MAEPQVDIMGGNVYFSLISCVAEYDKTISCMFYVNLLKTRGKVGKMCLIYGENVDIMVDTSGFCLVFTAIQDD